MLYADFDLVPESAIDLATIRAQQRAKAAEGKPVFEWKAEYMPIAAGLFAFTAVIAGYQYFKRKRAKK